MIQPLLNCLETYYSNNLEMAVKLIFLFLLNEYKKSTTYLQYVGSLVDFSLSFYFRLFKVIASTEYWTKSIFKYFHVKPMLSTTRLPIFTYICQKIVSTKITAYCIFTFWDFFIIHMTSFPFFTMMYFYGCFVI